MWFVLDNHMCQIRAKELYDSNLNFVVIYKISIFNEIAPNFTYSQKGYFLSIIGIRQTASSL